MDSPIPLKLINHFTSPIVSKGSFFYIFALAASAVSPPRLASFPWSFFCEEVLVMREG
jgi:hypothetical protein